MAENIVKVAQNYFIDGDFLSAKKMYAELNMPLELAYCEIYLGNLKEAKSLIKKLPMESPLEEWILTFSQLIEMNLSKIPSFLQIRNFYEIDLNNLFLAKQVKYIENVINMIPYIVNYNPEIFKFTARVLKDNGQEQLAMNFLKESFNICFFDSETHFLMAEICLKHNEKENALKHLKYACQNGEYYPAIKLMKQINEG